MKIVKEHINEKFTDESDPVQDMGIGMKHQIEEWLKEMGIKNYTINNDLTIDVDGKVTFEDRIDLDKKLENFPEYIQFRKITHGYFSIGHNNFTSLRGCPLSISGKGSIYNGDFNCSRNKLTSLKYAPQMITGTFVCFKNKKQFKISDIKKVCKKIGSQIII